MSKNKIVSGIIALSVLVPFAAFANTDCAIKNSCGNGSPELVSNIWGGTNSSVPHVQPGQSVKDTFGNVFTCPFWFTNYCVDITHTAYYMSRYKR